MNISRTWSRFLLSACLAAVMAPRSEALSPGFSVLKRFETSGAEPLGSPVQGPGGFLYGATYEGGANLTGTVFKVATDGTGYTVLHTFGTNFSGDGNLPWGVIAASDGAIYGVTDQGGPALVGTVFKVQPDGTGYTVLHNFLGGAADGARPFSVPVQGPGGILYGTTFFGGTASKGTIYSMALDGTGFTVLHSFSGGASDGVQPSATLVAANDGNLYGVAQLGGSSNDGVIFKIHPDGSNFSVLHSFLGTGGDGLNPKTRMIQANDGALYGTTAGNGVLFKINLDGSGYTIVQALGGNGETSPGVMQANNGKLYGTTIDGGPGGRGLVYTINLDGTGFAVIRTFLGGATDGNYAGFSVFQASDGALYGATRFGGPGYPTESSGPGTIFKLNLDGSGATTPFILPQPSNEASSPLDGLIQASDGALYGTTSLGGSSNKGAVIKIQTDGTGFAVLHSFAGGASDGATANDSVLEANDGALYGVTFIGGSSNLGTVYKVQRNGTGFTLLHSFIGGASEGSSPRGRLIQASDGVLYGTTSSGGAGGSGTVYKVNLDGSGFGVLYSFAGPGTTSDAANPNSGLLQASDGALYGTTVNGGAYGIGTVFKIQRDGSGYGIVHFFTGSLTDYDPKGSLIQGSDGAIYGTTYGAINFFGGVSDYGAVFKVNTDGSGYSVLHQFAGGPYDGGFPDVQLIKAANGSLYGSTTGGGTLLGGGIIGNGALFRLNEDGSAYGVTYAFTGGAGDGSLPTALVQASNGAFYGMTFGTPSGNGLIFQATLANSAPVAASQSLSMTPGANTSVTLTATDVDGDALSYLIVSPPANGMVTGAPPSLTYNSGGFSGVDTLTFVAFDGSGYSNLATVTLTGSVTAQTINFPAIANYVYGNAPFGVTATASSGLPVTFSILSGPATVSGSTVTITGAGPVVVQASQAGNGTYSAVSATQGFTVARAPAAVLLSNLSYAYDGLPKSATVTTAPVGLSTSTTYNGSATSPSGPGSYAVSATVTDPNYTGSATGTLSITGGVIPPTPTPTPTPTPNPLSPSGQPPAITQQPASQLLPYGGSVNLTVAAVGTAPLGYQWSRGGVPIPGATSAQYAATAVGSYLVTVSNSAGAATSIPAQVGTASRLANISGRVQVGTGDSVLILGFVVSGDPGMTKRFLIRAIGPGLAEFGITSPLARPKLTIYSSSTAIATNTGWGNSADPSALSAAMASVGAFAIAPGSGDSAVLVDLLPGSYSAVVAGSDGSTGIALAEAYELNSVGGELVNLSARVHVGVGSETAIVGFVVSGQLSANVLIRAVGPGLAQFGVTGTLAQPQLTVVSDSGTIATNQGWGNAANPAAISAADSAAGAFPLVGGSLDCAAILALPPGHYTALVTGAGATTGIALVEVYHLQ